MQGRLKEKDAWDIYYCLNNYPGGMEGLIQELHPLVKLSLVQEALSILADKFSSPSAVGPTHVADFDEITDQEKRERIQRDAFERVQYFLEGLGVEDIR